MATYTTVDDALAAYLANVDYDDGAGSVAKARAFRSACRALKVLLPQQATNGRSSTTMSIIDIRLAEQQVIAWLTVFDSAQSDPVASDGIPISDHRVPRA